MTTKYNPFYRTKPKKIYIPNHWGRLGEGEWVEDDTFSPPPKRESDDYLDARNLFRITHPIGDGGTNDRTDVGKLEALMHMAGVYDLDATGGPTGYYGARLKQAVRKFQKAHALRIDGDVNPHGETIRTIAQNLQGMGRRGDKVLAHLTPEEARFLHENTDGGSINPRTGLMEFNVADEKEGSYIWRTEGDGKVRESHADRDGEVFSWKYPPEGGHPGVAPNCRCTADETDEPKKDCEKILMALEDTNRRHDDLFEPIEDTKDDVADSQNRLDGLIEEREDVVSEISVALIPSNPFKANPGGMLATGALVLMLRQKLEKIDQNIKDEKETLADAEEKLAELEHKRENLASNAEEYSRRYQACIEKNK